MVPALLYVFRVPTAVVVGTSQFQILCTTLVALVLHAVANQAVDIVLAMLLIVGGVFGAQFGARAGRNLRAELFRFLLAILLLGVGTALRHRTRPAARPSRSRSPSRRPEHETDRRPDRAHPASPSWLAGARGRPRAWSTVAVEPPGPDHVELYRHRRRGVRGHRARRADGVAGGGLRYRGHGARPAPVPGGAREGDARAGLAQPGAAEIPGRAGLSRRCFSSRPLAEITCPTLRRRQQIGLHAMLFARRTSPTTAAAPTSRSGTRSCA